MEIEHRDFKGIPLGGLNPGVGFRYTAGSTLYAVIKTSDYFKASEITNGVAILNLQTFHVTLESEDASVVPVRLKKLIVEEIIDEGS